MPTITTFKTHPNFKCTFDPSIKDINDIVFFEEGDAFNPFLYQEIFEKKALTEEMKEEDEDKLQSFKIDPEKIDRIYYIDKEIFEETKVNEYNMLARIDNNPPLYIDFRVFGCCCRSFKCDNCEGNGNIFIFSDVNVFMTICKKRLDEVNEEYHEKALESLTQDYGENWKNSKYDKYEEELLEEDTAKFNGDDDYLVIWEGDNDDVDNFLRFRDVRNEYYAIMDLD